MNILITGGNGNIAKILKNNLTQYNITSISRNEINLLDFTEVNNFLINNKFDILIHCAITGGRRTKEEQSDVFYNNIIIFENLIKFHDCFKLIINFDSGAIYNRSTDIFNRKEEELTTIPIDYYGFSKYVIYQRTLNYSNIVNFRIFNLFHINEENDRFIKSCYNAKYNNACVTIFEDKYFDFIYESEFIKIINYYITNINNLLNLPKTINLSYNKKYKLSEIAELILKNKDKILIKNNDCIKNYCGCGILLNSLNINLLSLEETLEIYENQYIFQLKIKNI